MNSHYKDRTVSRLAYHWNGNALPEKTAFILKVFFAYIQDLQTPATIGAWWYHEMEKMPSTLLAIGEGNPLVTYLKTGNVVNWCLWLANKKKQPKCRWSET